MVLQNGLGFNSPYLPLASCILEGLKTTARYEFLFDVFDVSLFSVHIANSFAGILSGILH